MAYQKLQVSEGLDVIPSSSVNIPDPSTEALRGTTDGTTANKLDLSTATFLSDGIDAGKAIVYNTTDSTCAYVTNVDSDTVLSLSADIMTTGEDFVIYNAATIGCILYIGSAGDVDVQMAQQNGQSTSPIELSFKNVTNASFLPTQVVRVSNSTTASDIIALW